MSVTRQSPSHEACAEAARPSDLAFSPRFTSLLARYVLATGCECVPEARAGLGPPTPSPKQLAKREIGSIADMCNAC